MKSGHNAAFVALGRLTGRLPDVPTGEALHRNLIRRVPRSGPSRYTGCCRTALKAPSLSISPLLEPTPEGNIEGSTRMGRSKHRATATSLMATGLAVTGLIFTGLILACVLGFANGARAQGA